MSTTCQWARLSHRAQRATPVAAVVAVSALGLAGSGLDLDHHRSSHHLNLLVAEPRQQSLEVAHLRVTGQSPPVELRLALGEGLQLTKATTVAVAADLLIHLMRSKVTVVAAEA